jgi:hypothetical protein
MAEMETKELVLPKLPTIMVLDLVGKHLGLTYLYNVDDVKEVSLKVSGGLQVRSKSRIYTVCSKEP